MPEDIETIFEEIQTAADSKIFVQELQVISMGKKTLKVHLIISEELKIQIYLNTKTNNKNYVLLLGHERIYGKDRYRDGWHKHPVENPQRHEECEETNISDFLDEIEEILHNLEIL